MVCLLILRSYYLCFSYNLGRRGRPVYTAGTADLYIGLFVFLFGVLATGNMSNSVIRLGAFEHVVNAIGFMINAAFFSIVQVFNALWYVEARKATR